MRIISRILCLLVGHGPEVFLGAVGPSGGEEGRYWKRCTRCGRKVCRSTRTGRRI